MAKLVVTGLWAIMLAFQAEAASPFKNSLAQKKNSYLEDGVFVGGKAGSGVSVLDVRHSFSAKMQIERLIVDLGNGDGKPLGKDISYFQASVDAKQNRIVLDLAQLHASQVSEQKIQALLKKSPYVASAEFTLDPEDKAGSLVLHLKRPMRLEVFKLLDSKKPARVVLDLTPARVTSVKGH